MKVLDDFGKKIRQAGLGAMLVGIMSVSLVACGEETSPQRPGSYRANSNNCIRLHGRQQ